MPARTIGQQAQRRFGTTALDVAAAEARELRPWARDWIARRRDAQGNRAKVAAFRERQRGTVD